MKEIWIEKGEKAVTHNVEVEVNRNTVAACSAVEMQNIGTKAKVRAKSKKGNRKKVAKVKEAKRNLLQNECYSIRILDKKLNVTTLTQRNASKDISLVADIFNKDFTKRKEVLENERQQKEMAQQSFKANAKPAFRSNACSKLLRDKLKKHNDTQKGSGDLYAYDPVLVDENMYYKIREDTESKDIKNIFSSRRSSGESSSSKSKFTWNQLYKDDEHSKREQENTQEVTQIPAIQKQFNYDTTFHEKLYSPCSQRNKPNTHKVEKKQFSERKKSSQSKARNMFERLCNTSNVKILHTKKAVKRSELKYIPNVSIDPNMYLELNSGCLLYTSPSPRD
eukprot:TRINITY_DN1248_c0_g4_i3.p1 TRINITY_DN1248_c0_g4~~TRINITY_DN1248_c0_g4_i3.p1  ORF type:complete len:336 (+),score=77.63 TRINITY_DN1248_c0_g4_i3:113-1120(+)